MSGSGEIESDHRSGDAVPALLVRFLQRSSDAVFVVDEDGAFVFVNDAACRRLGCSREQHLRYRLHEVDPDLAREWADRGTARWLNRTSSAWRSWHTAQGGRRIAVDGHLDALEFDGRRYLMLTSPAAPADAVLPAPGDAPSAYRTLLDGLPFLVWLEDDRGRLLMGNDEYERWLRNDATTAPDEGPNVSTLGPDRNGGLTAAAGLSERSCVDRRGGRRWMEVWSSAPFRLAGGHQGVTIHCARDVSQRKAVEQELNKTLAFVQGIIDAFPDFLFEGNAEGRYLNAWTKNPELLAASREHMLGRTLDEVLSPESAAIAKAAFREADQTGLSFGKVIAIDTAVGQRSFELSVSRMPMGEGEPPHFITVSRDVTARLDLQAELEQQERQFRTLVENSPDAIARFDPALRCLYANPALAACTPATTLEGHDPASLFGDVAGRALQERLKAVLDSGEALHFEMNWTHAQGQAMCSLVNLTPEFNPKREITSVLFVGRDVGELRAYEDKLRRLVESNIIGVLFWRVDGSIEDANDAFVELLGHSREDMISGRLRWTDITPPGHEAADARAIDELRRTGRCNVYEKELLHRDGRRIPVLFGAAFLDNSRALGVAYVLDLTERKRADREHHAREAAEAASQSKGELLAGVSHEIRTPMNAIIGMSYLALQGQLHHQERRYIQMVHRSAESLLGIINDILDFSKIEAGKLDMESIDFDLVDVMDSLTDLVGMKAEEKGLELIFDLAHHVPVQLVGDPSRLGQVLLNLVNNAIKFTERGEIVVRVDVVERDDAFVRLRFDVRDSGIGITREQQQRLFMPFMQGDASTSRRFGGTGLGLAICQRLVGFMGGEIEVDSEPGKGSRFRFTARLGIQPAKADKPVQDGLDGARALVVDDNPSARQILVGMVRALGMRCDSAPDGPHALQMLAQEDRRDDPYQLLLIDWKMPRMDGVECLRTIEHQGFRRRAPAVLMVTAFGADELKRRLQTDQVSVGAVLPKPVTPSSLFDACCMALGRATAGKTRTTARDETLQAQQARLRGARILLVEDNAVNQELARTVLGRAGILVTVVEDGKQAVDILSHEMFDGVLMDCQMPVMDGYTASALLRTQERLRDLPIIAMTANAMVGDREKALAAGMNDQIGKPFKIEEMFATLVRWIRPEAQDSPAGASADADMQALGSLPGIDVSIWLASGVGDAGLYRRLLGMFLQDQRDFPAPFDAALASGDLQTLRRLAHSLKSLAATLGAPGVERAAAALEEACTRNETSYQLKTLLDDLAGHLHPVLEGLRNSESLKGAT